MEAQIRSMLADAYSRLGVNSAEELDQLIRQALDYFQNDRERFIEAVKPDLPEYKITSSHGVICHMIPLAQSITTEKEKNYMRRETTVLDLVIAKQKARFVLSHTTARLMSDPIENTYTYPIYRFASLEDLTPGLQVLPPQEIQPLATALDREAYGMIFMAIAKYAQNLPIDTIPHKTERAMLALQYSVPAELVIGGQALHGKLIPLAKQHSMWEEMRADHRYSYAKDLCIWIGDGAPRYLLKTLHIYRYYRKINYDDVPGGCAFDPTEETQETTFEFIALEDAPEELYPLYY